MKIKMVDFLFQVFFTLFVLPITFFCRIFWRVSFCFAVDTRRQFELTVHSSSFPRDLSTLMFHGNEVGIVPRFPSNNRCDRIPEKLAIFNTDFSILLILPKLFGNFKVFWFTMRFGGQIMRPWVDSPNRESWQVCS